MELCACFTHAINHALLAAAVTVVSIVDGFLIRSHLLTLSIPPLTAFALLYVRFNSPRAPMIRTAGAILAIMVFDSSILFGNGLTPYYSIPVDFAWSMAILLPTGAMLLINAALLTAWKRGGHLAKPRQELQPNTEEI